MQKYYKGCYFAEILKDNRLEYLFVGDAVNNSKPLAKDHPEKKLQQEQGTCRGTTPISIDI